MLFSKAFSILILSCMSLSAFAETRFECQTLGTGRNNYSVQIQLKDKEVRIQQSAIDARYRLIIGKISKTRFQRFPNETYHFSCQTVFPSGYSYRISVYESLVTVEQSEPNAKYGILAWKLNL
jgi:hypothetical protein